MNNKKRLLFQKIVLTFLIISMVASSLLMLTGCSAEKSPVQVLDETLQYWKNKNEKSFKKSFKNKKVAMYSLIETSADDNKDLIEISKKLEEKIYSGLKYKILSDSQNDASHATVDVQISTIDTNSFLNEFIKKIINFYYESKSTNSSLKEEQFYEEINEDFEKIIVARNFTVTVKFQKINKEWKITNNETLINALTGGYLEYQY
ncbi:hypothetical protein [Thomasclavelia ramosa]|uniref:hypothetical protein n=1 Tax=Thomasclavelia ramosa TaxID=1547 RepID=UPI0001A27321|nr:hypothetical protein MBAG_02755 [Coprobacillus sp. D7]